MVTNKRNILIASSSGVRLLFPSLFAATYSRVVLSIKEYLHGYILNIVNDCQNGTSVYVYL